MQSFLTRASIKTLKIPHSCTQVSLLPQVAEKEYHNTTTQRNPGPPIPDVYPQCSLVIYGSSTFCARFRNKKLIHQWSLSTHAFLSFLSLIIAFPLSEAISSLDCRGSSSRGSLLIRQLTEVQLLMGMGSNPA